MIVHFVEGMPLPCHSATYSWQRAMEVLMLHGHLMVYPDADISMPGAGIFSIRSISIQRIYMTA
jgi:hypothetical protein